MYPENPEGTRVIVGSRNMGYISDTARNRTHNLFRPKREPIPLDHSDGRKYYVIMNKRAKEIGEWWYSKNDQKKCTEKNAEQNWSTRL